MKIKKDLVIQLGISTALGIINIPNHGYQTGETIKYSVDGTSIDGLSTDKEYYLFSKMKIQFKLASVGVGTTTKDFYLKTNQFKN